MASSSRMTGCVCGPPLAGLVPAPLLPHGLTDMSQRVKKRSHLMAGSEDTARTPPADTAATLREREHSVRDELHALTMRTDLTVEERAKLRDDLERRLAQAQEQLARAERLTRRARERRAT